MLEPQWNQFWKFLEGCFSNRYLITGASMHVRSGHCSQGSETNLNLQLVNEPSWINPHDVLQS